MIRDLGLGGLRVLGVCLLSACVTGEAPRQNLPAGKACPQSETRVDGECVTPTPDVEPDTVADTEPDAAVDAETDTVADTEPDAAADAETDTVADTESDTVTDAEPDTVADSEPDAAADAETDTVADTAPDVVTDAETDTVADSEPDAAADAETDTVADTAPDVVTDAEQNSVAQPDPDAADVATEPASDATTESVSDDPGAETGDAMPEPIATLPRAQRLFAPVAPVIVGRLYSLRGALGGSSGASTGDAYYLTGTLE